MDSRSRDRTKAVTLRLIFRFLGAKMGKEDDAEFGENFGQKVDLTTRIREILRNYPEGISILKVSIDQIT